MRLGPRHVGVLVNPVAGGGRGAIVGMRTLRALRGHGVQPRALVGHDAAESRELARTAVGAGVDALVVVGGDGMVHEALQVVAGTETPLGIVAAGTGNDAARSLGLPRRSAEKAAAVIMDGHTRTIDLARTGGRYYVTVLATGFDSCVNERANQMTWPRGQARYILATLAELRSFRPLAYTLDLDGEQHRVDAMLVAVGNGPSYGGGLQICEGALLDDGLLDVVVIKPLSRVELVKVFPRLYNGTHVRHPAYQLHRARRVTLAAAGIAAYADGERVGTLPLTVECVPAALRVFAVRTTPGRTT